jgi:poly-gamma-glutamate capsule biosynthesis protein CapA/YwtB (metallophosphatase superfamily)
MSPIVAWGGDVNLGRRQHYRTAEMGVDNVLKIPALAEADLSIVNLECVVSTQGEQGINKGEGGPYYYRARPQMLGVLLAAGIDVVTTANNHSGDYGPEALLEQMDLLNAVGIAHAGTGANREAAFRPVITRACGLNVAIFSVDATQHRFAATDNKPGTAYLSLNEPSLWIETLAPKIAEARKSAHVVLVAVHWGENQALEPSQQEIAAGHALIDAGADAVMGASAHLLQGIEVYKNRPIIYDAGDLLFDAVRRTFKDTGVFQLKLNAHGVEQVAFFPVGGGYGYSEQLAGQAAVSVASRYAKKCLLLGTQLDVTPMGWAFIQLHPPERVALAIEPVPSIVKNHIEIFARLDPKDKRWVVDAVPDDARIEPIKIGALTLIGIRVTPRNFTKRQMLWVESFWSTDTTLTDDFRIDFCLVPVTTERMAPWGKGMDHDPCDWMMPTSTCKAGLLYRDYYGLRPPYLKDWVNGVMKLSVRLRSKDQTTQLVDLGIEIELKLFSRNI